MHAYLLGMFFLSSSFILLFLPLDWRVKGVLFLVLVAYGVQLFNQIVRLRGANVIQQLTHLSGKQWLVSMGSTQLQAEVLGDSTVTKWVSILRFRCAGRRLPTACVVFSDSLAEGEYHELRLAVLLAR